MKIILKEDLENLGRKGDIIEVAAGYGRNYLIPKKLALEVTFSNQKMIEIERLALKKIIEQERLSFQELIQNLNEASLAFRRKAGEKDVIFGSVSSSDIKDALDKLGFEIDRKKILLDEPIKRLGNYTIPIKIYHDDRAEIKVEVVKEEEAKEKKGVAEKKSLEEKSKEKEEVKNQEKEEADVEVKKEQKAKNKEEILDKKKSTRESKK